MRLDLVITLYFFCVDPYGCMFYQNVWGWGGECDRQPSAWPGSCPRIACHLVHCQATPYPHHPSPPASRQHWQSHCVDSTLTPATNPGHVRSAPWHWNTWGRILLALMNPGVTILSAPSRTTLPPGPGVGWYARGAMGIQTTPPPPHSHWVSSAQLMDFHLKFRHSTTFPQCCRFVSSRLPIFLKLFKWVRSYCLYGGHIFYLVIWWWCTSR